MVSSAKLSAMDNPFNIEEDNNPSLYGKNYNEQLVNNSITVSNTIHTILNSNDLTIAINQTEKLINSSTIVYLIEISGSGNVITVKRRYSEFKSLRDNLNKLYPTVLIPPVPEKHSLLTFFLNSLDNDKEVTLIEFRKRFFSKFLNDLISITQPLMIDNILLKKFFDPNYELCWNNAINEPPINQLPKNMLLCNPLNPLDPNGLYLLLPKLNNFDNNIGELYKFHNLDSLLKLNDNLLKLNNQIKYYKFDNAHFKIIPNNLIQFETYIHDNLKILKHLNKVNIKHSKNFKSLLNNLINLGGNLNNCSLEIFELNKNLSNYIEKFGSIIDLNYLNYESFYFNNFIPNWQESISQLILYFEMVMNIINFYKFKIIQFLILFKLKFNKFNQLVNLDSLENFDNLKSLNSTSVNNFLKNKQLKKKHSWYKIFGGGGGMGGSSVNPVSPPRFKNPPVTSQLPSINEPSSPSPARSSPTTPNASNSTPNSPPTSNYSTLNYEFDHASVHSNKIESIQRDLDKLDQLITLSSNDLLSLNTELTEKFNQFMKLIEKKWLIIFLDFIQSTKQLFIENLNNWNEFKQFFASSI